jgi:hypothetical protein
MAAAANSMHGKIISTASIFYTIIRHPAEKLNSHFYRYSQNGFSGIIYPKYL